MADFTVKGGDKYPGGEKKFSDGLAELERSIRANPVGLVILTAIRDSPRQLSIWPESLRPDNGTGPATFPVTADGKPGYSVGSPAGLSRAGTGLRDKWYAGKYDDPDTEDKDERFDPAPRSWGDPKGGGSDARIYFSLTGEADEACSKSRGTCASRPDEILLHEMVHALRHMQGVANSVPTTPRYKNEEEFLALVVANVYMSKKKGNKLLRPDYVKDGPLLPPLNTSAGFLKDAENKKILDYYSTAWQPVFGRLGEVDTDFNPFRPYVAARKPK
jgi:hypothetical protein